MRKYIKALYIATTLLLIPGLTLAQSDKLSPYIGIYGGYGELHTFSNALNREVFSDGMELGAFAGLKVNKLFGDNSIFNFAVEVNAGTSGVDGGVNGISFEKKHDLGLSFRPGFTIKPTSSITLSPYAILGYRRAKFSSTGTTTSEETFNGFELGLGTNLLNFDNWGVRFEYSRTFYQEDRGVDVDEDAFRLGMGYYF
jgi:opacity protein-like surface antigen